MKQNFYQIDGIQYKPTSTKATGRKLTLNQRKIARRARELIGKNKGRWIKDQQKKYFEFIKTYKNLFFTDDRRRFDKVFMMMSNHLKSRTADQCKTHHQKLLSKFKTFSDILQGLSRKITETNNQSMEKMREKAKLSHVETNLKTFSYEEYQKCFDQNLFSTNFISTSTVDPSFNSFQSDEINIDIFIKTKPL